MGLLLAIVTVSCSRAEHTLVVVSPLEADLTAWVEAAYGSARPDVDVRVVTVGSRGLLERLAAEPDAGVVWGASSWELAAASRRELLAEPLPSWAPEVPSEWKDPSGRWVGSMVDPLVLAFDHDEISRSAAPRDWIDLFHVRFAAELLVPEPGSSEAGTLLLGSRAAASLSAYGDPLDAIGWFLRLDAQALAYGPDESALLEMMARGEGLVAPVRLSVAERMHAAHPGIDYRTPESVTPLLVQGVAVLAGAPDPALALDFVEWLGSPGTVQEIAERFRRVPAIRPRGGEVAPGWPADVMASMRTEAPPADTLAVHLDEWVDLWRTDARGRATRVLRP